MQWEIIPNLLLVELDLLNFLSQEYELNLATLIPSGHKIIEETISEASKSYDRLPGLEYFFQETALRLPEIHLQKIIEELADIIFICTARGKHIKVLGEIRQPYQSYTISFFVPGEGLPPESVAYFNSLAYKLNFLTEYMAPSLDWFVAKRLVEMNKGDLVIESTMGIGTTLSATLPLNVML